MSKSSVKFKVIKIYLMKFTPEQYVIPDKPMQPFIDEDEIWEFINNTKTSREKVKQIITKSLEKKRLTLEKINDISFINSSISFSFLVFQYSSGFSNIIFLSCKPG